MKILFITSSRLGDAVLSTGLLDHIIRTYPGARITVACGGLAASLFEGMPGLDQVIIIKKQSFNRHWLKLWMKVVSTRWDMVVDLRDSIVSRAVVAKKRFVFGRGIDKRLHKVEQNAVVMRLAEPPSPVVFVSARQAEAAARLITDGGPVLAVGPTANWVGKTWPAERFIQVVAAMIAPGGLMPGARVAVFAAPGEEDVARQVLASVPEDKRIDMIAKGDPGTAGAALKRCAFYMGNDSGLMHCAAAAGVPTVGLFGPSWPYLYRPWGVKASYVSTPEDFAQLIDVPGYDAHTTGSLMESLTVEAVLAHLQTTFMSSRAQ